MGNEEGKFVAYIYFLRYLQSRLHLRRRICIHILLAVRDIFIFSVFILFIIIGFLWSIKRANGSLSIILGIGVGHV